MKRTLIYLIFIILISCNSNSKENIEIVKTYHENGNIKSIERMLNNKKNGECSYYNENGILESRVEFKDDLVHGKQISYYEEGGIHFELKRRHGKRDGEKNHYYYGGRIIKRKYYSDDEEKMSISYHENEKINVIISVQNDNGFAVTYDKEMNLKSLYSL